MCHNKNFRHTSKTLAVDSLLVSGLYQAKSTSGDRHKRQLVMSQLDLQVSPRVDAGTPRIHAHWR